jgi:hypothetical protein
MTSKKGLIMQGRRLCIIY